LLGQTVVWLTDSQIKALARTSLKSLAPVSALVRTWNWSLGPATHGCIRGTRSRRPRRLVQRTGCGALGTAPTLG